MPTIVCEGGKEGERDGGREGTHLLTPCRHSGCHGDAAQPVPALLFYTLNPTPYTLILQAFWVPR